MTDRVRVCPLALLLLLLLPACGDPAGGDGDAGPDAAGPECATGERRCSGLSWLTCAGGRWQVAALCLDPIGTCVEDQGCLSCPPGERFCVGDDVVQCTSGGTVGTLIEHCDDATGEGCAAGVCVTACEAAAARHTNLGCEYWPTPLLNLPMPDDFDQDFGVLVMNVGAVEAEVSVSRGGVEVDRATVTAGATHTFALPLDTGLQDPDGVVYDSVQVPDAAYHLVSTVPVLVYQLNPLHYEQGGNHSYSNDASLLLPTHALSGSYLAMSRPTQGLRPVVPDGQMFFTPGFVTVVGTGPDTHVTVALSAHTAAGPGIAAASAGEVVTFTLGRGEAVQLVSAQPDACTGTLEGDQFCDQGPTYDLTGTRITADAPVAVFSGHAAALVPFDRWAADHLEEQLPPLEAWGKRFLVTHTVAQNDSEHPPEPNVVRLVSGAADNVVRFDPPHPVVGASLTLQAGQWRELEIHGDLSIEASGALLVGQLLVGQEAYTLLEAEGVGDPSLALVPPREQHRAAYPFEVPGTFVRSYVNVVKRVGPGSPSIALDGAPVDEAAFEGPIGGTDQGVARIPVEAGGHVIESDGDEPFGIMVYGFAPYTSYLYPGGMNLLPINPVL